jgi:hypothetical protein
MYKYCQVSQTYLHEIAMCTQACINIPTNIYLNAKLIKAWADLLDLRDLSLVFTKLIRLQRIMRLLIRFRPNEKFFTDIL